MEETSLQAEAVGALFAQYEERIARFLAQIVRSRALADDLLQETFLTALRAGDDLAHIENKQAWLFAIARNRALEALRKERRRERALERLRLGRKIATEPDAAIAVRDLLERNFSPDERVLLVLRYVHDFDANELSDIVDASPAAVRQRLSRLRRRLLHLLKDPSDQPREEKVEFAARPLVANPVISSSKES